jgi:hypothetical protein
MDDRVVYNFQAQVQILLDVEHSARHVHTRSTVHGRKFRHRKTSGQSGSQSCIQHCHWTNTICTRKEFFRPELEKNSFAYLLRGCNPSVTGQQYPANTLTAVNQQPKPTEVITVLHDGVSRRDNHVHCLLL